MKKDKIITSSIREIKSSFKRFLSLLVMSLLGVGVFVGIKMAAPDMLMSVDKYYKDNNVYDIKIISTLGLTKADIESVKKINGVKKVVGSHSKDVLINTNKEDAVIKVLGITKDINKFKIVSGRNVEKDDEILVEEDMLSRENLKIGDKIKLADKAGFKNTTLKIVGTVKSPLYISNSNSNSNRGITNIGSGKINYYTYTKESNFDLDYYTEIYVLLNNTQKLVTNSDSYNKKVDNVLNEIETIKKDRQKSRYEQLYKLAEKEILKNKEEGSKSLSLAKASLNNAKSGLDSGKLELDNTKHTLDVSLTKLNSSFSSLEEAKKLLEENKVKLDSASNEISQAKETVDKELEKYNLTYDDIDKLISDLEINDDTKNEIIDKIPEGDYHDKIVDIINGLSKGEILDGLKDFISDSSRVDEIINNLPPDIKYHDEIISILEIYKENKEDIIKLGTGIEELRKAEREYNLGLEKYNLGMKEYTEGYNKYLGYYNEYQNGMSLYNNGLNKYNSNLNLYNSKVSEYYDATRMFDEKIAKAEDSLKEIPKAKWYTYERLDDAGYSSYIDDGESVNNLAKIFPTIFFIVAVLISLISMSRMVEDDRILIGTFKSLGFGKKHIIKKYIIYSGLATILGGIIGSLLGFFLLPKFVWNIYKILFDVPVFKYDYNPTNVIVGILIAVICICGTTLLTIKKVVEEKPSELMRPKPPTNGKRVILERFSFIWKKISFSNKITIRNLFRYKKRVIMTIGGILGCTALMLAGFGIRDSIVNIPNKQFEEIFHFDEMVYLTNNANDKNVEKILNRKDINNKLNAKMDISMTSDKYEINIFVPEETINLNDIISIKDLKTKKSLTFEEGKVIISDKLAALENKKVGDNIKITDSNNKEYEYQISAICENYVGHYVFMDKNTYESTISEYKTNIVYLNIKNLNNEDKLLKELLKSEDIMSVISVNTTINSINDMLKSLNSVVLILIILSGALSFVVLYNLSYINISERKREIATLKVLGFTDKEVDNYITKETIILTIFGIILGLLFGILLTNVIINTIEIEMVRFIHNIKPISFIITATIIMLFTLIVNKTIHFALKKIDMIESLKSVE